MAVQPRVCGEHLLRLCALGKFRGSAPRVRGTRPRRRKRGERCRFSPACAGNTTDAPSLRVPIAVRPACPGNTPFSPFFTLPPAVQPRVCGEHAIRLFICGTSAGSAPRVRGTPGSDRPGARKSRFSPACAGNTFRLKSSAPYLAVQPRVCGEHSAPHRELRSRPGSAPRVRGTRPSAVCKVPSGRFSPACAGNTPAIIPTRWKHLVQPRVCGEHRGTAFRRHWRTGSAPRVRGTPLTPAAIHLLLRFSPACAGNTVTFLSIRSCLAVQPRVCGEHRKRDRQIGGVTGSAPRVRGTRSELR